MKFIISSKYFYNKILEILMHEATVLNFKEGVLFFRNDETKKEVFVSTENIEHDNELLLKIDNSALYKMLHFLEIIREQPIVVKIDCLGYENSASFAITQTVANF